MPAAAITMDRLERDGLLAGMRAHAERDYPRECCGLVLRDAEALALLPCANVIDEWHARDPGTFPRTSRNAYLVDPRLLMTHERALAAVYHSHPDGEARFSAEDVAMAAPLGEPLWPGLTYVVVAVRAGAATDARLFAWDAAVSAYAEVAA